METYTVRVWLPDRPGALGAVANFTLARAVFTVDASALAPFEFLRLPYDAASTEAKATAAGYRIGPWLDRLYSARHLVFGRPD